MSAGSTRFHENKEDICQVVEAHDESRAAAYVGIRERVAIGTDGVVFEVEGVGRAVGIRLRPRVIAVAPHSQIRAVAYVDPDAPIENCRVMVDNTEAVIYVTQESREVSSTNPSVMLMSSSQILEQVLVLQVPAMLKSSQLAPDPDAGLSAKPLTRKIEDVAEGMLTLNRLPKLLNDCCARPRSNDADALRY